jgi:hypothetical protein
LEQGCFICDGKRSLANRLGSRILIDTSISGVTDLMDTDSPSEQTFPVHGFQGTRICAHHGAQTYGKWQ